MEKKLITSTITTKQAQSDNQNQKQTLKTTRINACAHKTLQQQPKRKHLFRTFCDVQRFFKMLPANATNLKVKKSASETVVHLSNRTKYSS
jgi:hypothetical protein